MGSVRTNPNQSTKLLVKNYNLLMNAKTWEERLNGLDGKQLMMEHVSKIVSTTLWKTILMVVVISMYIRLIGIAVSLKLRQGQMLIRRINMPLSAPTKTPTGVSSPPSPSCTICDDEPTKGMKKK